MQHNKTMKLTSITCIFYLKEKVVLHFVFKYETDKRDNEVHL